MLTLCIFISFLLRFLSFCMSTAFLYPFYIFEGTYLDTVCLKIVVFVSSSKFKYYDSSMSLPQLSAKLVFLQSVLSVLSTASSLTVFPGLQWGSRISFYKFFASCIIHNLTAQVHLCAYCCCGKYFGNHLGWKSTTKQKIYFLNLYTKHI